MTLRQKVKDTPAMSAKNGNRDLSFIASLNDPASAAAHMNEALALGDAAMFLLAIQDVINARGEVCSEEVQGIGERIGIDDESQCEMMFGERNPELEGVEVLLDALGFRLVIEVKQNISDMRH